MPNPKNPQERRFCVYEHIDPVSRQTIYVGSGLFERAYRNRPYRVREGGTRGSGRSPDHYAFLSDLQQRGFHAPDWTRFVVQGVDFDTARQIESILIQRWKPRFNDRARFRHDNAVDQSVVDDLLVWNEHND